MCHIVVQDRCSGLGPKNGYGFDVKIPLNRDVYNPNLGEQRPHHIGVQNIFKTRSSSKRGSVVQYLVLGAQRLAGQRYRNLHGARRRPDPSMISGTM